MSKVITSARAEAAKYSTAASAAKAASIRANCKKVVCIGRNYADHIAELKNERPRKPFFFLKPPSSILFPNEGPIRKPRGTTLHYEVELALLMGKRLDGLDALDEESAMGAVESYLLAIDLTARNVQDEARSKGLPWTVAKGFDTFLPLSPPIPKAQIPDPHNVRLWLSVNKVPKQDGSTALMLFKIPHILSDISSVMTLEPGDIVLTGTPKGVGPVQKGDVITAGLGGGGGEGGAVQEMASLTFDVDDAQGRYTYSET